jgi:hypothetical protein
MVQQEAPMKDSLGMHGNFCVGCKEKIDPNIETDVIEIRVGTIQHGIFNRAYNYPANYVHEGCYFNYLTQLVEGRKEYASNSDKGNPA